MSFDVDDHFALSCDKQTDHRIVVRVAYAYQTMFDTGPWTCTVYMTHVAGQYTNGNQAADYRLPTMDPFDSRVTMVRDGAHYAILCTNGAFDMNRATVALDERMDLIPVSLIASRRLQSYLSLHAELFRRQQLFIVPDDVVRPYVFNVVGWHARRINACRNQTTADRLRVTIPKPEPGTVMASDGWPTSFRNASLDGHVSGNVATTIIDTDEDFRALNLCQWNNDDGDAPTTTIASTTLTLDDIRRLISVRSLRIHCQTMGLRTRYRRFSTMYAGMLCADIPTISPIEYAIMRKPRIIVQRLGDRYPVVYTLSCKVPRSCSNTSTWTIAAGQSVTNATAEPRTTSSPMRSEGGYSYWEFSEIDMERYPRARVRCPYARKLDSKWLDVETLEIIEEEASSEEGKEEGVTASSTESTTTIRGDKPNL